MWKRLCPVILLIELGFDLFKAEVALFLCELIRIIGVINNDMIFNGMYSCCTGTIIDVCLSWRLFP